MMRNNNKEIIILLDNIRSVYNVGSIFRSSDGAGVSKIILCGISATPSHPKVVKTSLGAEKSVDWEYENDALAAIQKLKVQNYKIICAETAENPTLYNETDYGEKSVIVFGHEVDGINPDILQLADLIVSIPMHGVKESLNVSVACGIIAYEACK